MRDTSHSRHKRLYSSGALRNVRQCAPNDGVDPPSERSARAELRRAIASRAHHCRRELPGDGPMHSCGARAPQGACRTRRRRCGALANAHLPGGARLPVPIGHPPPRRFPAHGQRSRRRRSCRRRIDRPSGRWSRREAEARVVGRVRCGFCISCRCWSRPLVTLSLGGIARRAHPAASINNRDRMRRWPASEYLCSPNKPISRNVVRRECELADDANA